MENQQNIESSNVHFKWLDNIYNQLIKLQEMETLALEGCASLGEYLEIPQDMKNLIIPEIQYKNLRFIVRELNSLIDNLAPLLKTKTEDYKTKIFSVINIIENRNLFLREIKKNGNVIQISVLPFFKRTLEFILTIKSELLRHDKVMAILYLEEDTKKKW